MPSLARPCSTAVLMLMAACGGAGPSPVPARIQAVPAAVTLPIGAGQQLTVTVFDADNRPLPDAPVSFVSSDIQVATVASTGFITAVAAGAAAVTVQSPPAIAAVAVTVIPVPDQIQVTPPVVNLVLGTSQQLSVSVLDANGQSIATAPLTFSSSDTTLAKVSATGLVTAVSVGAPVITVRSRPASATVGVNVFSPASIDLTPESALLVADQTQQLVAVARDGNGQAIPGAPVTYTSRDPSIVTVSAAGVVTPIGVGTTYVLATSGTAADSTQITALVARVLLSGTPTGAAVSPAGVAYVTRASANTVARMDLPTPSLTGSVAVGDLPSSVTFNQAGDRAYVGNQGGGTVSIVNVGTNTVIDALAMNASVTAVAVAPGDSLLLVGTDVGRLYVVQLPGLGIVDSIAVPSVTNALATHDTLAYASAPFDATVIEINLHTRQAGRTLTVGGVPQGLVVAPSGAELYIANETGQLQIWNLSTNTLADIVTLPGGGGFGLARNPSNGLLYVSTSYYGSRVHVIDPLARRVVRVISTGSVPRRIAFTPSGSVGIVANEDGWVDFIR